LTKTSWTRVEAAVFAAIKRKGATLSDVPPAAKFWAAWMYLANNTPVPEYMASAMSRLAMIRNKVAHNPEFEPTLKEARDFVFYCDAIVEDLYKIS
jgi:hypothetical protein